MKKTILLILNTFNELYNFKINEIDRNIVEQFIENIYVNNDKTVEIRLKYKDQYEDAIMYLKNQKNMI